MNNNLIFLISAMSSLLLDAEIRNWVLIPLFVVLFLVGILR